MKEVLDTADLSASFFDLSVANWAPYALIVLALIGAYRLHPKPKRRPCHWVRKDKRDRSRLVAWSCRTCRADAFATGKQPPQECKRNLQPRPL